MALCDHQYCIKAGMWKFLTPWLIQANLNGTREAIMRAMFTDYEMWRPMLDQTVPAPARISERYGRISLGDQLGMLDDLRSWKFHSDYDPDRK